MNLIDVRDKAAALLAPITDSDPNVLAELVDSIAPPALMLGWGEPWLEPDGLCALRSRFIVTCIASRLEPGNGYAVLEQLVTYVNDRLGVEPENWVLELTTGPRVFIMARVDYLACRMQFHVRLDG